MGSGITSGECTEHDEIVNISHWTVSRFLYTPIQSIVFTIVIPIIWCLGIVTNSTFLFVMFRVPTMRTDTNFYLANMAIADVLYLSLSTIYYIWAYLASPIRLHDPFSHLAGCSTFFPATYTVFFASTALVTTVSFERYLALCHPIKHLKMRGKRRTKRLVAICWLVGAMFGSVSIANKGNLSTRCFQWPYNDQSTGFPSKYAFCSSFHRFTIFIVYPIMTIPWFTALAGSMYMYSQIISTLNRRKTGISETSGTDPKALRIRNQVAKMLVINGTVFFLGQITFTTTQLADWICWLAGIPNPLQGSMNAFDWLTLVPELLNGTVNPLIYSAVNSQFRAALRKAFWCKDSAGYPDPSWDCPDTLPTVAAPRGTGRKKIPTSNCGI